MLTALALAAVLNSAPVAHAEDAFVAAVYAAQGARAERAHHTAELGTWLDSLDSAREMAMGRKVSPFAEEPKASPFANDGLKPDPFEGHVPHLFWWPAPATKGP